MKAKAFLPADPGSFAEMSAVILFLSSRHPASEWRESSGISGEKEGKEEVKRTRKRERRRSKKRKGRGVKRGKERE